MEGGVAQGNKPSVLAEKGISGGMEAGLRARSAENWLLAATGVQ